MGEGSNNNDQSAFSSRAVVAAVGTVLVALVPLARDASMSGVSRLLSLLYVGTWIAILGRTVIQIHEGYWREGLKVPLLFEMASVAVVGLAAWMVFLSEDPQIPRLLVCAAIGSTSFLLASGKLEEARADLVSRGIRVRRVTEIARDSRTWRMLCRRVSQIRFGPIKRLREFFAGPDTRPGHLSLGAAVSILILAVLAFVSGGLAIASIVFPLQLTPDHSTDTKAHEDKNQEPNKIISPPATANEDNCRDLDLGTEMIPEPQRSSLRLGWQEVKGLQPGPMEALGYDIAGCPGRAKEIPKMKGSWYRPGYCGAELRSVVVAPEGMEHPVVLLEQAAEFALPLIVHGEFAGAVDRFPVGHGDAYIIDSHHGSNVLIRDRTSAGPATDDMRGETGGCADFKDQDVRYAIAGPGMIEPWRAVAAISLGGVYPIDYARNSDGSESVVFRSPEGIVAQGICAAAASCVVDIGTAQVRGQSGTFITEEEVRALVEP